MTATARIPARVREQEEAAERAIQEAQAAEQGRNAPEGSPAPAATPPAPSPAPEQDGPAIDPFADVLAEGSASSAPGDQPTADQLLQQKEQELAAMRQRLASLEGRIEAEGPRNAELIRELKDQLRQIREEREAAERVPGWKRKLKPEEQQQFQDPDEALGVSGRAAVGILEERLEALERTLQEVRGSAVQREETAKGNQLMDRVDSIVPGAKALNASNDPLFVHFLKTQTDPVSGLLWGQIGFNAQKSGDVGRLVQVFEAFYKQSGQDGSREVSRKRLVRPETVRGANTNGNGNGKPPKRIFKTSEINKFWGDVRKGVYRGRDEDKNKIERAIDEAAAEGRIERDT